MRISDWSSDVCSSDLTEAMKDGSDAVSDWPLLNALLNTASGATWVSLHHGGGVGMGYSQHAGMVIVADGTPEAAERLKRVLWNDNETGVMRKADEGYEDARSCAAEVGLDMVSKRAAISSHAKAVVSRQRRYRSLRNHRASGREGGWRNE